MRAVAWRHLIMSQVVLLSTSALVLGQVRPETARITLEDLLSVQTVGAPVLSADGTQFAMIRDGQIVLMPSDGGWPVTLTTTSGAKSEVSWSPDSKTLAFVSDGGIWIVPVAGGQPTRLTDAPPGPGDPRDASDRAPRWCPKGKWILFQTGRHGQNELMVVSEDGRTSNHLTTTEIYEGRDRRGGQDLDPAEGVSGDRFDPEPAWSPDGTRIAYTERSREQYSGKLKVLSFDFVTGHATGAPAELYTARPDRGGSWAVKADAWSPDSKTLAVLLQDTGWDKVYLLPSSGGPPKLLTLGDSEDVQPEYSPDGKSLAIVSNRNNPEERRIWIVPVDGAAPRRLTQLPPGAETNPQWSPDSTKIYFLRSAPLDPPNLYVASATGQLAPRALTRTLPLNFARMGFRMPDVVHFKSKDGLSVAGMLYRPPGFTPGRRYPAVLWVHGGPESQDMFAFVPWMLFLAQEGYLVLQPNYRGSVGYGEKFRNLNVGDYGGGHVDDVIAGAQYLVEQGLADPKRLAIGGASHGGMIVNHAVTKYPDVFAAAIDLYGDTDRVTFMQRVKNRNSAVKVPIRMGGTPEENPAAYRKANILPDVPSIKTPILIMHGEEDPQVPVEQSAQLVDLLKKEGKTYLYVTYPREGHGFVEREHRLDAWKKQQAFLRKYLQPS